MGSRVTYRSPSARTRAWPVSICPMARGSRTGRVMLWRPYWRVYVPHRRLAISRLFPSPWANTTLTPTLSRMMAPPAAPKSWSSWLMLCKIKDTRMPRPRHWDISWGRLGMARPTMPNSSRMKDTRRVKTPPWLLACRTRRRISWPTRMAAAVL